MIAHDYTIADAAMVIQWHIFAMFAPSFFTGNLIVRFGVMKVIGVGLLLLVGCGTVALGGMEWERFLVALVLLGLGWNFRLLAVSTIFRRVSSRTINVLSPLKTRETALKETPAAFATSAIVVEDRCFFTIWAAFET